MIAEADSLTPRVLQAIEQADWRRAAAAARRQVELRRASPDSAASGLATALTYLSLAQRNLGDFDAAERAAREVVAIAERNFGTEHPTYATALNNLAGVLRERGELIAAEALYRRSLATRVRLYGSGHATVAASYNNLATVLQQQGDWSQAEHMLHEALSSARASYGDDHPNVALALENLAAALRRQDKLIEAEACLREAWRIVEARFGPDHVRTAYALQGLAGLLAHAGKVAEADSLLRACLALRERSLGADHVETAQTRDRLGALQSMRGRPAEAVALHERALQGVRAAFGDAHPRAAMTQLLLGGARLRLGSLEEAESALTAAVMAFERARVRAASGLRRATLELDSPYPLLAVARLQRGDGAAAWQACERSQGRVLAELLSATRGGPIAPALRAQRDSLVQEVTRLEAEQARLEQASAAADAATVPVAALRRGALLQAEAALAALQERIARRYPAAEGRSLPPSEVQALLSPADAMIGWLDADDPAGVVGRWCWVLRANGAVRWFALPLPGAVGAAGDGPEARLRSALVAGGGTALGTALDPGILELAHAAFDARLAAAMPALQGAHRLIVVPSGAMLGVPVEALVDGSGNALIDRFAVTYAPSAALWAVAAQSNERRASRPSWKHALLLGDPPFRREHLEPPGATGAPDEPTDAPRAGDRGGTAAADGAARTTSQESLRRLPRLRWSRREIQAIAHAFDQPLTLLGDAACEQRLDQLASAGTLATFGTLHFATHALADAQRPEDCALVLAQTGLPDPVAVATQGAPAFDGLVTAREIVAGWRLNSSLVTLSACETALGRRTAGDGYLGLAYALLQAGSANVLVSLWAVDDRATALLMAHFYDDVAAHARPSATPDLARSLRAAKQWLRSYVDAAGRRPYEHPRYWAGFVLLGARS